MTEQIVILDFGSQYTQVIAQRIRECNVYSVILRHDTPAADLSAAVSTAWSRQVGNLFVTDLGEPNPYDALPSYWSTEAATIAAQC